MKILLTNDDGIYAKGLRVLHERFLSKHQVTVIAPDRERSAVGHGITLHEPLRVKKIQLNGNNHCYSVSGTPADCIKMGILNLISEKPDLVISGINPGANTGINVNYSGTVAAAREAALYGINAIAVSIRGNAPQNYDDVAIFAEELAGKVMEKGLPFGTILNVNFPDIPRSQTSGIKITRQGTEFPHEYIEKSIDPRKREYFWYGCELQTSFDSRDVDEAALHENFISITPILCDLTHYGMVEKLMDWNI